MAILPKGVRYRKTPVLNHDYEKQVIEAYQNSNETVTAIAKRFGIAPAGVTRVAKKYKIPLRNKKHSAWWE